MITSAQDGKTLSGADLLLIDELSYARFNQEESEMLFKVIAERSERASTVITTNLEFPNGRRCLPARRWLPHWSTAHLPLQCFKYEWTVLPFAQQQTEDDECLSGSKIREQVAHFFMSMSGSKFVSKWLTFG